MEQTYIYYFRGGHDFCSCKLKISFLVTVWCSLLSSLVLRIRYDIETRYDVLPESILRSFLQQNTKTFILCIRELAKTLVFALFSHYLSSVIGLNKNNLEELDVKPASDMQTKNQSWSQPCDFTRAFHLMQVLRRLPRRIFSRVFVYRGFHQLHVIFCACLKLVSFAAVFLGCAKNGCEGDWPGVLQSFHAFFTGPFWLVQCLLLSLQGVAVNSSGKHYK